MLPPPHPIPLYHFMNRFTSHLNDVVSPDQLSDQQFITSCDLENLPPCPHHYCHRQSHPYLDMKMLPQKIRPSFFYPKFIYNVMSRYEFFSLQ